MVNFPLGAVPFVDGTIITDQLLATGLVFAGDGSSENRIQDRIFNNPSKVRFITAEPVMSVSATIKDQNSNLQTYFMTAYDRNNNILDQASFTDPILPPPCQGCGTPTTPDRFTLTVSSCKGIAYVWLFAQFAGARFLERITYTTKR